MYARPAAGLKARLLAGVGESGPVTGTRVGGGSSPERGKLSLSSHSRCRMTAGESGVIQKGIPISVKSSILNYRSYNHRSLVVTSLKSSNS